VVVSVGYMSRYGKAVRKMKGIIREAGFEVMMTPARYVMGDSRVECRIWAGMTRFADFIPWVSLSFLLSFDTRYDTQNSSIREERQGEPV
jgi:hypothetical protein